MQILDKLCKKSKNSIGICVSYAKLCMKIKEFYWLMRNLYKFMIIYAKIKESYWLMRNFCKIMHENQRILLVNA